MAMSVPTWGNAGVEPSAERKQEGYSAGQNLPANHLNWLIYQAFTNLQDAKTQLESLTAQSSGNNTYIDSVKTKLNKLVANMPIRAITGTYTGTGGTQNINIGATPIAVLIADIAGTEDGVLFNTTHWSGKYDGTVGGQIVENGFNSMNVIGGCNTAGSIYNYIAFIAY